MYIKTRAKGRTMQGKQAGFSLVEIAVVLVIIGLLIGGLLQGTEMIDNSRIKKAASDFQAISTAYIAYQDRYQALPGDDGNLAALNARGGDWTRVTQANNNPNGAFTVALNDAFDGGGEHDNFWQHLRAAGYVAGDPSETQDDVQPRNAFGGLIGMATASSHNGLTGVKMCMSQVPGKSAAALDVQLDDGSPRTGDVRANQGTSGANTIPTTANPPATYSEANEYTICKRM